MILQQNNESICSVCSTGIQPEVSMFAVSDSSEDETTEGELSDDELTETLEEKLESLAVGEPAF